MSSYTDSQKIGKDSTYDTYIEYKIPQNQLGNKQSFCVQKNNEIGQSKYQKILIQKLQILAQSISSAWKLYQLNSAKRLQFDQMKSLYEKIGYQNPQKQLNFALIYSLIDLNIIDTTKQNQNKNTTSLKENILEYLIQYNLQCFILGKIKENQFFKTQIRTISSNFKEQLCLMLADTLNRKDPLLIMDRIRAIPKTYSEYGKIKYCLRQLDSERCFGDYQKKQIKDFTKGYLDIRKFSQGMKQIGKERILNRQKYNYKFHLYRAKLKHLLNLPSCLQDLLLSKHPNSDQDSNIHQPLQDIQLYNQLLKQLLNSQINKVQQIDRVCELIAFKEYRNQGFQLLKQINPSLAPKMLSKFQDHIASLDKSSMLHQSRQFSNPSGNNTSKKGNPTQNFHKNTHNQRNNVNNLRGQQRNDPNQRQRVQSLQMGMNMQHIDRNGGRKVLSIDGGGIKIIFGLVILAEMEYRMGRNIYQLFDLYTGTSIGGIAALIFATKKISAKQLLKLIVSKLRNRIFPKLVFGRNLGRKIKCLKAILNQYFSCQNQHIYDNASMREVFQQIINQYNIEAEVNNNCSDFIITSCIKDNQSIIPCIFHKFTDPQFRIDTGLTKIRIGEEQNFIFQRDNSFDMPQIWQIMMATSALNPLIKQFDINGTNFYDGGYYFNNPSLIAIKYLQQKGINTNDIKILSIGLSIPEYSPPIQQSIQQFINNTIKQSLNFLHDPKQLRFFTFVTNIDSILTRINQVDQYSNRKVGQILSQSLYRIDPLSNSQLRRQFKDILPDSDDYHSIRSLIELAQYTINNMDNNNDELNDIISHFDHNIHGRNRVGRIIYRTQIITDTYLQLNKYFSENIYQQNNQRDRRSFKANLRKILQKDLSNIMLPRPAWKSLPIIFSIVNTYNEQKLLTYALAHSHPQAIDFCLQHQWNDDINRYQTNYKWNAYSIAHANDRVISLHKILTKGIDTVVQRQNNEQIGLLVNHISIERTTDQMIMANISQINEVIRKRGESRWFTDTSEKNPREMVEVCKAKYVRIYYQEVNRLLALRWTNMRRVGPCPWVIQL